MGLTGLTRGIIGLFASLLGKKVLDMSSPSNGIFLTGFSLMEGIGLALFMQIFYGDLPFFSLIAGRILPQAIYTGVLGVVLLQLMAGKKVLVPLMRRSVQKEL